MSLPHTFFAAKSNPPPSAVAFGYFGVEYGGWTGDYINASPSAGDSEYAGSTADVPQGLDQAMDWNTFRLYGAYNTVSQYSNHSNINGGVYNGAASFYTFTGARTDLSGWASSGMGSNGRGVTIAYLSDGPRTPVLVAGNTGNLATTGIYIYRLSDGSFLGSLTVATLTPTYDPSDLAGLAWDGTHVIAISRSVFNGGGVAHRILLPAAISGIGSANVVQDVILPHAVFYGAAWGGYDNSGLGYLYLTNQSSSADTSKIQIDWATGSASTQNTYSLSSSNYSLFMDTKNRRLVLGGYSNNRRLSFGE